MNSNGRNYIKRLKRKEEGALKYVLAQYLPLVEGGVYKVLKPLKQEKLLEESMNDIFSSV